MCIWHHRRCTKISSVRKSANARVRNFYAYENFCDYSSSITLKSRVIMHMITSTARRPYSHVSTRSEPVECSSACKDKELGVWAIEQQGRVIDEWRSGRGSFAFAGQPVVDHLHPAAFRWHASSKKNRPSWCFLFEWQRFMPLRTAWRAIGYPFSSVPARCTKTTLAKLGERPTMSRILTFKRILLTKSETKKMYKESDPIFRCATPSTGQRLGEVVVGTLLHV